MATSEKPKSKQYESRHRFRWAADFPLKPGRDVMARRGLLALIADTAITGQFWQNLEKLSARAGISESGLRKLLVKLCAEGALKAQYRGYKRTTVYTLQRLAEVVQNGGAFLPAEEPAEPPKEAQQRFPRTSARDSQNGFDRPYRDAYIGVPEGQATKRENGVDRPYRGAQTDLTVPIGAAKKRLREEEKKYRKPNGLLAATANGAPRLPSASTQTLSSFSSTEEDTHPDERPISPAALELDSYLTGGTGRPLPGSWLRYPGLERQMDRLGFIEVGSVLSDLARQNGGHLPEPEKFFGRFGAYRQIHLARSRPRNGRRRAA